VCVKAKLELVTGAGYNNMIIEVYGKDDQFVCRLDDNDALIGSYPIDDGARLHVTNHVALLCVLFSDHFGVISVIAKLRY